MYDRPETVEANDALWDLIARHLGTAPPRLDRALSPEAAWTHPDLVLSQTCGLPYSLGLHKQVSLVGSPDFGLPNCPAGSYYSVIITRKDEDRPTAELLSRGAVLNDRRSQSGHNALFTYAQHLGAQLGPAQISGSHVASAQTVATGSADIAAIDATTWRMIARWDDWATKLQVVTQTPPTPAMPFICARHTDATKVHAALKSAIADLPADMRETLGLYDLVPASKTVYLAVPPPPL